VTLTAAAARGGRPGALHLSGGVTPTPRAEAAAARLAIENTLGTIHGSQVVTVGFGQIGAARGRPGRTARDRGDPVRRGHRPRE
jgi:hypothetical protein